MRRFLFVSVLALGTLGIIPFAHAESTVVPSCTPGVGASGCGTGYSCDKNKNACIPNSVSEGNQPFSYIVRSSGCFAQVDCAQFGSAYACDLSINTCVPAGDVSPQAGTPDGLPAGTTAGGNILNGTGAGGSAPGTGAGGINLTFLEGYKNGVLGFINTILAPVLISVAFIFFLYSVYLYFIQGASEPKERETGRIFVLYAVIGFAVIFSLWGLVNLATDTFGFGAGGSAASHGLTPPTL